MEIQRLLGSDIQMVLDECPALPASDDALEKSLALSMRWAKRSRIAFGEQPGRACFGIVQGGTVARLRQRSAQELQEIGFDGYAVGGLAVGEGEAAMFETLDATVPHLPKDKPRYLMDAVRRVADHRLAVGSARTPLRHPAVGGGVVDRLRADGAGPESLVAGARDASSPASRRPASRPCTPTWRDITPPEQRARAYGLIGAAFSGGFVLGPVLGGVLGEFSPRAPFWVAACLSGVAFLYGLFILPESLPKDRRMAFSWKRANPFGAMKLLSSHHELFGLTFVNFLLMFAHHVFSAVFVLYAGYRYHWTPWQVGLLLSPPSVRWTWWFKACSSAR